MKYRTIIADPPWRYGKWGTASETGRYKGNQFFSQRPIGYQTMTVKEIMEIQVSDVADENCDLYLWTTQKYLPDAFGVMQAWGFRYCATLVWCKSPRGLGQGGLFCPTTEFLLQGRKGRMPEGKRRIDSTWWQMTRTRNHSQKPEAFQDMIETVSDPPRLEMFARRQRDGWDVWGNEVENSINLAAS